MSYQEWLDGLKQGDRWTTVITTSGVGQTYYITSYEVVRRTASSIFVRREGSNQQPTRFNLKGKEVGGNARLRSPATEEQVAAALHHNRIYRLRTKLSCFAWRDLPEDKLKAVAEILGVTL